MTGDVFTYEKQVKALEDERDNLRIDYRMARTRIECLEHNSRSPRARRAGWRQR